MTFHHADNISFSDTASDPPLQLQSGNGSSEPNSSLDQLMAAFLFLNPLAQQLALLSPHEGPFIVYLYLFHLHLHNNLETNLPTSLLAPY